MKAIELFAGTRSFGKIAEDLGIRVYSLDYDPKHNCELTIDILDFDPDNYKEISPDIIWASPDCTSFSFASSGFHRTKDGKAKTEKAFLGDRLLDKTIDLIDQYLKTNPRAIWYIENPRGHMAKHPKMIDFLKKTGGKEHLVTYCSYGGLFRKPTNIWTNNLSWIPKSRCGYKTTTCNGAGQNCHHVNVKRNSCGGISSIGKAGDKRRSIIPEKLILEIIGSTFIHFVKNYGKS